jgi:hypothetical protein
MATGTKRARKKNKDHRKQAGKTPKTSEFREFSGKMSPEARAGAEQHVQEPRGYRGKQAKTGNSLGFRFDKALFQSHPEFAGSEVRGHVLGPGSLLVVAERTSKPHAREEEPVLKSFLSFLAHDIISSPETVRPVPADLMARIDKAVGHLAVDPDEDLGDSPLL